MSCSTPLTEPSRCGPGSISIAETEAEASERRRGWDEFTEAEL